MDIGCSQRLALQDSNNRIERRRVIELFAERVVFGVGRLHRQLRWRRSSHSASRRERRMSRLCRKASRRFFDIRLITRRSLQCSELRRTVIMFIQTMSYTDPILHRKDRSGIFISILNLFINCRNRLSWQRAHYGSGLRHSNVAAGTRRSFSARDFASPSPSHQSTNTLARP